MKIKKAAEKVLSAITAAAIALSLSASSVGAAETGLKTSGWSGFRGNENGTITAHTPYSADTAREKWTYKLKDSSEWDKGVSDIVTLGENVAVAVGGELTLVDKNGKLISSLKLDGDIEYTCRLLAYGENIFVPLKNGRVEAVNTKTFTKVYTTPALEKHGELEHQTISALYESEGYIYTATACADWTSSYFGTVFAFRASDGDPLFCFNNETAGYYGAGAAFFGNYAVIAGDDGKLISFDKKTGAAADVCEIGAGVRSTIVKNVGDAVFTSTDGALHRVTVSADGKFSSHRSVGFAAFSTSAPVVSNGVIYAAGGLGEADGYKGVVAAVNYSDMKVMRRYVTNAQVQSALLLNAGYKNASYIYFTCNNNPGGIYCVNAADSAAKSELIYTPEKENQNYCMATPAVGNDGTIYYTNDSGMLFAVRAEIPVDSVTLNKKTLKLSAGQKIKLSASASPSYAFDKTVIWKSSNAKIASVKNGVVTAKSAGKATITAVCSGKTASVSVKVNPAKPTSFKVSRGKNGAVIKLKRGKASAYTKIYIKSGKKTIVRNTKLQKLKIKLKKGSYKIRIKACKKAGKTVYSSGYTGYKRIKIK